GSSCTYARKVIAKDKLNQGVIAFNEGHRETAKALFKDAIDYYPDNAVAWLYLGAAQVRDYKDQDKDEAKKKELANEALQTFEKALTLSENNCTNKDNAVSNIAAIYDDLKDDNSWRTWMLKRAEDTCSNNEAKASSYKAVAIKYWNCALDQTNRYADKAKLAANDMFHYRDMDYPAAQADKKKAEDCTSKGLEYMEKAIEQYPEDADSLFYKGLLYRERQMLTKDPAKRKELEQIALKLNDQAVELQKRREAERRNRPTNGRRGRAEAPSGS
ncbi:MAG: hypothetical protein J2P31_08205, partial [Blastocatellia bacterium]|nr:hypothetical protein [Blastocatellia bacterium]